MGVEDAEFVGCLGRLLHIHQEARNCALSEQAHGYRVDQVLEIGFERRRDT